MIAALFVESGGCYFNLPNVDPWPESRDARLYAGPHAVVAHPPCERWGRYWYGGPMLHVQGKRKQLGDDGGCFAHALWVVRQFGGVLEHPEASAAWDYFGLLRPMRGGGWSRADNHGWTCCVDQGDYGHRARKATWLYACHAELPALIWHSKTRGDYVRLEPGCHSSEERARLRKELGDPEKRRKMGMVSRMTSAERAATPIPFRDLLISIAESAQQRRAA